MRHFCDLVSSAIDDGTKNFATLHLPIVNKYADQVCQLACSQFKINSMAMVTFHDGRCFTLSNGSGLQVPLDLASISKVFQSKIAALDSASNYSCSQSISIPEMASLIAMPIGFADTKCKTLLIMEMAEALEDKAFFDSTLEFICNGFVSTINKKALLVDQQQIHELHQLILQQNRDWIFVKDKDFKLAYVNQAFLNLYPKEKHDKIIGYTTFEEYEEKDVDVFLAQDKIAFETGLSHVQEDITMPDGSQRVIETTKRRFTDQSGEEYILGIAHDITEQHQLIKGLKKANAELDEFANIASHDLKAPLNAIQRLLQWIEKDCEDILPDDAKSNFAMVMQRADRMKRLLNDMLRYARLGRDAETPEHCNFKHFLDEALAFTDGSKAIELSANTGTIFAQPTSLKTVLVNLISNAVKHNDKEKCILDAH